MTRVTVLKLQMAVTIAGFLAFFIPQLVLFFLGYYALMWTLCGAAAGWALGRAAYSLLDTIQLKSQRRERMAGLHPNVVRDLFSKPDVPNDDRHG